MLPNPTAEPADAKMIPILLPKLALLISDMEFTYKLMRFVGKSTKKRIIFA